MNRYLLDTDIFSKWAGEEEPVSSIVESQPINSVFVSVVTVGEVIYGWHAEVKDCPREELVDTYGCVHRSVHFIKEQVVLPFTSSSLKVFASLRRDFKGYDPYDLHIASIAIENQLILVTNNTADFEPITAVGLKIVNWNKPKSSTH
ncbi:MAG: type II toxin-antitoxin system VapC family toxin [Gemmatales bacterium]